MGIIYSLLDKLISFKADRQQKEWESRQVKDKLKLIVYIMAMVSFFLFKKKITITDIFRTQEENDKIYGWKLGCGRKRKYSVHSAWRGVDIRIRGYKKEQLKILVSIGNSFPYDVKRSRIKTAKWGDKLHTNHIHFQCFSK